MKYCLPETYLFTLISNIPSCFVVSLGVGVLSSFKYQKRGRSSGSKVFARFRDPYGHKHTLVARKGLCFPAGLDDRTLPHPAEGKYAGTSETMGLSLLERLIQSIITLKDVVETHIWVKHEKSVQLTALRLSFSALGGPESSPYVFVATMCEMSSDHIISAGGDNDPIIITCCSTLPPYF